MYYYKARIYSPTLGRFLQTDPIGYEDQFNLYGYVGNDPINGVDPTGLFRHASRLSDRNIRKKQDDFKEAFASLDSAGQQAVADAAAGMGYDLSSIGIEISPLDDMNAQVGAKGKGKGERNRTAKASGTPSPFKKLKKHPSKEGWVQYKDQNGKTKSKKGTPEELDYLDQKGRGRPSSFTSASRTVIPFGVGVVMCVLAPSTCSLVDVDGNKVLDKDDWNNY